MRASNQRQVVPVIELFNDIAAEEKPGAAGAEPPALDLVRVGPEEVTHGAVVGHFLFAVDEADFVDFVD